MHSLSFNPQAASAISARNGGKLRMEVRDGTMFIRPTDRKAGPHVLTEIEAKGKGIQVQISDKQFEKLASADLLADGLSFGLRADKYGWYALTQGEPAEGDKSAVEGATVSVAAKGE
jgi:hypothetical protein